MPQDHTAFMQDGGDAQLDWNGVRDFLAVVRTGSLNRAAETLGVNATTVGRRIEALERGLGVRLFRRSQSGFLPTDEGHDLFERAEQIEAAAMAFERRADVNAHVRGRVRLATAENLANHILLPALPRLRSMYPDLTLEIATDVRSVNLHRREADIALRLVRPTQGNVTIKRLGTMRYGLYGSADYFARRGEWTGITETARFETDEFIGWSETHGNLPAARWIERTLAGRAPAFQANSLFGQVVAARAGIGLAALPCFMGSAETTLQRLPSAVDAMTQDIWLVVHADLSASARVRAVARFVEGAMAENTGALEGWFR